MNIRYETDEGVVPLESREDRGATALDPDKVTRAEPRKRRQSGFPINPDGVPTYGASQGFRRSSQVAAVAEPRRSSQVAAVAEPRRSSQVTAAAPEPRRSSQTTTDPMAGATLPFQRARGKRYRMGGEHDPHHTQTFGPAEPLPPSPAAIEATSGWFEPSLRTEAIPDLIGLVGDTSRTYDPNMSQHHSGPHSLGMVEETQVVAPPGPRPLLDMHARPWLFPLLLATTCLAVGMVIGALVFGAHGDGAATKSNREVIVRCSDPPAR